MSIAPSTRGTEIGSVSNVRLSSQGFRFASTGSENEPASATGEAAAPEMFIWGTDVSVEVCKRQFKEFLKDPRFTVERAEIDEARLEWHSSEQTRPLYITKLDEIFHIPDEPFLTINCAHLKEFDEVLYRKLVNFPTEVIQIFDIAANELFQELYSEHKEIESIIIGVRPFNIDRTITIRGLNPSDTNKLVTIHGMVIRCSSLIPEMIRAFFKCTVCFATRNVKVECGQIAEPHVCTECNNKFCFQLIHNRCNFIDRQMVKLQESPDNMPAGQTPSTISLIACADLVDKVHPGDRVFVTGIYRSHPVRVLSFQRKLKDIYKVVIDILHYRKVNTGQLHEESSPLRFSPERIDKLKALAKDENIYERLAMSMCPSIYGHMDVKKGVLLQLFGGTKKVIPGRASDPKLRHFRSEVNILLCGDPGTSKSQILQYVYKLVPRGQYTSGKGSSAVGLTAYVTRDLDTKQLVLQTGALVMCDGGICCIDEFDKMSDSTRSVLHEVMEQQTLSIAKAGIVCQLNAKTSVLAAANPVGSEWAKDKTIIDNIRLPETLLSRFDLIFLMLDPNSRDYDRALAKHLISYYGTQVEEETADLIPPDILKDYIAYSKLHIQPKLTEESSRILVDQYVALRKDYVKGRFTAYPRNLESLIRISEAHARLRHSTTVDAEDLLEAVRVTKEAIKHNATDPNTGKIDGCLIEDN